MSKVQLQDDLPARELSPLARLAGALLLAAALFGMAAVLSLGTLGWASPWGWGFSAATVVCILGWMIGRRQNRRAARDAFGRQRGLLGINAWTSVLLLLALLVGLNYIAFRRHKTFDLTNNRVNSLSDQSLRALQRLPSRAQITYVYGGGQPDAAAVALLNAYKNASDKVGVSYLNALAAREEFERLRLSGFNGRPVTLIALEGKDSTRQEALVADEQNITSALLKLIDPKPRALYFLTGHGELNPLVPAQFRSLSAAGAALQAQNYRIQTLSLQRAKATVPKDAAVLVIAAPQVDLAVSELKSLQSYARAGRLVLLLTPTRAALPRWNTLLRGLGLGQTPGLVQDLAQSVEVVPGVAAPVGALQDRAAHPLLRGVSASVAFPQVTPLIPTAAARGLKMTPLFQTSRDAIVQGTQSRNTPAGPFLLAAAAERTSARAVVVADADFATDQFWNTFGNASFFLSCVNWTVGQDALVSIPPKAPVTNTLNLPDAARRFVPLFCLYALPASLHLIGALVWWKRR